MDMVHALDGILSIFSDLGIGIIKFLLHLPFVLNTRILKDLEGSTHVLHLTLELCQVLVLPFCFLNHFII